MHHNSFGKGNTMNYRKIKKIMAILLIGVSLAGCTEPGGNKSGPDTSNAAESNEPSTVEELADYFMKAAEGYASSTERAGVLEGLEGSQKATRLQMLVLASRAFGRLPAPEGTQKG